MSCKELIKILNKFGFIIIRQRGSHVQLEKVNGAEIIRLTVPMHPQLKRETLSSIIKASKIDEKELEKYF
ncbi:type II toxin-antitoxin system HicA family toxin [Candidatus Pacearchaeota archaeon]|nr:type II toxin-antitoxin system HicA family toxin [Candidatus Pacearchaeota archaeon]